MSGKSLLLEATRRPKALYEVQTGAGREVREEIARFDLTDCVMAAGVVPRAELSCAYRHPFVDIFASECENCPNILLQAMAAGRPVLVSNSQPMSEFGGDAVAYFDSCSPRDFASPSQQSSMIREPAGNYCGRRENARACTNGKRQHARPGIVLEISPPAKRFGC